VPFIGLVNLVAGEEVAPELIQGDATAFNMADRVARLLEDEGLRRTTVNKLAGVRERLGTGGASCRTAEMALEMMKAKGI
jgi:lipid-A-disaccharide synthase